MDEYVPSYNTINEARATKTVITSEEWNALFNILATQGNKTAEDLYNFITLLKSTDGASVIASINGTTIQELIADLELQLANCYTQSETDTLLATKENVADADGLIKTIAFNSTDGKFTITTQGGTETVIDTNLEKTVVNITYNSTTKALNITYTDNTITSVSLADFVTTADISNPTFSDSSTLDFTVTDNVVTAGIKEGSITAAMLSSEIDLTPTVSGVGTLLTTTLTVADWVEIESIYRQTLDLSGIDLTGYAYIVTPAMDNWLDYSNAQIRMETPTVTNQVRFWCTTVPTTAIAVNILKVRLDS